MRAPKIAPPSAFGHAQNCLTLHGVKHGEHCNRQKDGSHSGWHVAHLAVMVAVNGGILQELGLERRHQGESGSSNDKVGHESADGGESDAGDVHGEALSKSPEVTPGTGSKANRS
jgi:hypothetical protein